MGLFRPLSLLSLGLALSLSVTAAPIRPEDFSRLQALSQELKIPVSQLQLGLVKAQFRQPVLDAIQRPWEAKPWSQYRPIFLTPERISAGAVFWQQHAELLARAEAQLQVPAQVIVAILGVETYFGTRMGDHPVLDALYTLGFHYPPRGAFFSKEFAQYVRLAAEQGWEMSEPKGSYAGAMGMGQFIPSSYLHYAIDFDGDGHRDLFHNPADAIGSVANYFHEHNWQLGTPVAHPVKVADESRVQALLSDKLEITTDWQQLQAAGVTSDAPLAAETPVKLIRLEGAEGTEYWAVEHNFYVITRYNRSPLYAMAVYQLSQAIAQEYHAR
ncbi:lytic murein transglycosylase B [Pseudaeromonas paramecii]|uniref:Lytic murein transglycosylase B n=1 Tax=Pseudaeromonas paramecii TaxID=2138166 RepID=A0ABP8QCS9_9GAMM